MHTVTQDAVGGDTQGLGEGRYPGAPCAVYQPAPQLHTPASLFRLQLGQSIMGSLLTCFWGLQLEFTDCTFLPSPPQKHTYTHVHTAGHGPTWLESQQNYVRGICAISISGGKTPPAVIMFEIHFHATCYCRVVPILLPFPRVERVFN